MTPQPCGRRTRRLPHSACVFGQMSLHWKPVQLCCVSLNEHRVPTAGRRFSSSCQTPALLLKAELTQEKEGHTGLANRPPHLSCSPEGLKAH